MEQVPEELSDPFEDDWMQRGEFARSIQRLIRSRSDGVALWLDGNWGVGKTMFAGRLATRLRQENHLVVEFNAFEVDFADDAFLPLADAILEAFESGPTHGQLDRLRKAASAVGTTLLPILARGVIRVGTLGIVNEEAQDNI